jgi:hypothetical protein
MFAHHKPAAVREEKSSSGVVRIGVGVGVFVVLAVITDPYTQLVLEK